MVTKQCSARSVCRHRAKGGGGWVGSPGAGLARKSHISGLGTLAPTRGHVVREFQPDGANEMDMTLPTKPESLGQPQPTSTGVERVLDESKREAVELSKTADQVLNTAQVDERAVFQLFDDMSNSTDDFRKRLADLRIGDRDTCESYLMRWACAKYSLTLIDGQRGAKFDPAPLAASLVALDIENGALDRVEFGGDKNLASMVIQERARQEAERACDTARKAVRRAMIQLFDDPEKSPSTGKAKADEVAALMKRIVKLETESLDRLKAEMEKLDRTRASSK